MSKTLSTRRAQFIAGLRDTIPLIVGAIPFGIIFGALAISNGLSLMATLGMSLFVFAGSSQFIAAGLVGQGAGILLITFTTFVVNLRHALYSATLAPHLKHLPQRWLLPLGFWLTDETFAITAVHYEKDDSPYKHWYQFGSSIAMYLNWSACTLFGALVATQVPQELLASLGLDFAMVVTFIGIVVPLVINRPVLGAVIAAGVVGALTYGLPNKLYLIFGSLAGVIVGLALESMQPNPPGAVMAQTLYNDGEQESVEPVERAL